MGICHGWAPAAYMLPRPRNTVRVRDFSGNHEITFYPSDIATLIELAGEIGVDQEDFRADLACEETDRELRREIAESRSLGIEGFPSLVVIDGGSRLPVPIDYTDPVPMLRLIREGVAGP